MITRLPTIYQNYIHQSRYARYNDEQKRRETWHETVDRYIEFFKAKTGNNKRIPWQELRDAILNLKVVPSMRSLMTAGPALEKDNIAGYNCSYLAIDNPKAFDEIMYILMCGTGVGFSVESRYVNKMPEIPDELHDTETTIVFRDSKIGWATGYREFVSLLYSGKIAKWDVTKLREEGVRLKTFGGRASGPDPLIDLMNFTKNIFHKARGRKLSTLECHDIICKIADIVVCGGVRRSALISLSDLNDDQLRNSKSGQWWLADGQRALSNNSAVYESMPNMDTFMKEWFSLYRSKSGERGIFSRVASQAVAAKYERRDPKQEYGTNPCSEIILRPYQFCNLSEVVVRAEDTPDDLKNKVRLATILGTLQSTLSDFRYLNKRWKNNTEEERLLGVSLTGIMDHVVLSGQYTDEGENPLPQLLAALREEAVKTNKHYAKILGVEASAAITCVKPSGTVSQLVDSASGIHPRYSKYYVRRVRQDKKDPLATFLITKGYVAEEDFYSKSNWVFSFPIKSPEHCLTNVDLTAIEQLELWKTYQEHWCEHKPSITVYVGEEEWMEVGAWVYKNLTCLSGVSFLPRDTGSYRQAPYEEITKEKYEELLSAQNLDIDWTDFHEETDNTEALQQLACTAGVCDIL
jgi:ribonucleoside-diphosphate reductase alpha chain